MFNDFSNADGGFFNASTATDTPTRAGGDKGGIRIQNVTPVCVRQVRDCPGEEFSLFGMKAQILSLVVILRSYDVTSTKATYSLEDHTGTITALLWLNNDSNDAVSLPSVKEGHYCKVYGSLRTTDGVKTILILNIGPVEDINEVTSHLLQVIHCRYAAEAMMKESGSSVTIASNNPSAELANSMSFMYDNANTNDNNFTPVQQKIYGILKTHDSENGLSIDFIKSNFSAGQHRDVNAALDFLSSEGHIYTTIDEQHFRRTD